MRELIDGSVGLLRGADNLHLRDPDTRRPFHDQIAATAERFRST